MSGLHAHGHPHRLLATPTPSSERPALRLAASCPVPDLTGTQRMRSENVRQEMGKRVLTETAMPQKISAAYMRRRSRIRSVRDSGRSIRHRHATQYIVRTKIPTQTGQHRSDRAPSHIHDTHPQSPAAQSGKIAQIVSTIGNKSENGTQ